MGIQDTPVSSSPDGLDFSKSTHTGISVVSSATILSMILLLISPILQTLSKATTSDSIWPLSACLLLLNAMLAEYGCGEQNDGRRLQSVASVENNNVANGTAAFRLLCP